MSLVFEWDERKRLRIIEERGIDFLRAAEVFDGRPVFSYASPRSGEDRWVTVGNLSGQLIAVVWTRRGESIRIITARRARRGESETYCEIHAGRG